MLNTWPKLILLTALIFSALLLLSPQPAEARWPPFDFQLTPVHEAGKITYSLKFSKQSEGPLTDVVFKIPLPAGTRYLEAVAQPGTDVQFDGREVTFFTALVHRPLETLTFTVEITDPARTSFTTQAWIAWKGDLPGDYLVDDLTFDLSKQPLAWSRPQPRLRLDAIATVVGAEITYTLQPRKLTNRRMWDVRINLPLPPGTSLISTAAPAEFGVEFDGREVSFSIIELERRTDYEPLRVTVSAAGLAGPVVTHAWAKWDNVGRSVGRSLEPQQEVRSGDLVAWSGPGQSITADPIGDVPFFGYDLTSAALSLAGGSLKADLYTADAIEPEAGPFEFMVYLDTDCRTDTGGARGGLGAEYWLRYRTAAERADLYRWKAEDEGWERTTPLDFKAVPGAKSVSIWTPLALLDPTSTQLCWIGRARNLSEAFDSGLTSDWTQATELTNLEMALSQANEFSPPAAPQSGEEPWGIQGQAAGPLTAPAPISGKLAVPLLNSGGGYDTHIFNLPDGQLLTTIPYARQPHFHPSGERLLINRAGSGGNDSLFEVSLSDGSSRQVSDRAGDTHPFYDPWGNRLVHANAESVPGKDGEPNPFIFVQCGVQPPHLESDPQCQNISEFGVLVAAGHMSEIWGSQPVWASPELIVYNGCNSWAGFANCGLYQVPASSTKSASDGLIPRQLTTTSTDAPTDAKHNLIAFNSERDGNWEAYVMNLNGEGLVNLSHSPASNDGLPTLSPDGHWAAFTSDRDGQWAIWVAPTSGGPAQKLFDLPTATPWGATGWLSERISWGP